MKALSCHDGCRNRPRSNSLYLGLVDSKAIPGDHITEKKNPIRGKLTLLESHIKLITSHDRKNGMQMMDMFLHGSTEDKNIIKINAANLPMKGRRAWFMTRMNVLGALDNPKGITSHSNRPSQVLKDVFTHRLVEYESDDIHS